ncbi:MAG TPA: DNA/RNA non-specific endonuclease [Pyrinomonadaceae bacterium]|nr:DNA/RNA non-specific endonuclease [Pyrinomonadaceae bacterium]
MKATTPDTRQSLRRPKTLTTRRVLRRLLLWAALLCAAPGAALGQRPGTMSVNLNDAGDQIGRLTGGVSAPPAAFAGGERPDTASVQMSFPLLSLPGRGINVDLGLNYDSSLYQLTWNGRNAVVESTVKHPYYPAYGFTLGYGMLVHHAALQDCRAISLGGCSTQSCNTSPFGGPTVTHSRALTYFDKTGARHRIEKGISVDSSDLRQRVENGAQTVTFPDGTKVIFGSVRDVLVEIVPGQSWLICNNQAQCVEECKIYDRVYYPTRVIDRNGNFIQIAYRDSPNMGPKISSIRDTLGRTVSFRYDAAGNLQSIAAPGFAGGPEREVARFFYRTMTRVHDFADQQDFNESIRVLEHLFLPGTKTGWHFSYSSYGQVYRVERRAGMEVDSAGALTNAGTQVAVTEYDYNGTPLNPTTNMLFQLPRYTRRTDDWLGNASGPVVHQFAVNYADFENKSYTYITAPDGTVSEIQKRWYHATEHSPFDWKRTWDEGLVYEAKIDNGGRTYARLVNDWVRTDGGPRLRNRYAINDAGQQARVEYFYNDPPAPPSNGTYSGIFSNVREMKEYGFGGELLRRTEYLYVDNLAWTGRWLVKLQRSVKVFEGASTVPVSHVEYGYDEGEDQSYPALPDTYDTSTPSEHGNVTSVTANTNAGNPAAGTTIVTRVGYDIFGNAVSSTDAIGSATADPTDRVTRTEFSADFKYAYPTSVTTPVPDSDGSHGSDAAHVTRTGYDFNTGLAVSSTDVNGQITTSHYSSPDDPPHALNRLRRVVQPDGGETVYEYGDAPGNVYVRTTTLREAAPTPRWLDTYEYFDSLGRPHRSYTYDATASTPWIASETKFDVMGREAEVSNPVRVANHGDAVPPGGLMSPEQGMIGRPLTVEGEAVEGETVETVGWTATAYDALGRPVSVTTPDGAVVHTAYSGNKTMVTDQAGKSRRRETDALDRLVQVVEFTRALADPTVVADPNTGDYLTSYVYDAQNNLTKVTQGEVLGQGCPSPCQERVFTYDSLSRRRSVRNPESGTISYVYDDNGNLKERVDARGVRTTYEYDTLNRAVRRAYDIAPGFPAPEDFTATPQVEFFYDGKGIPAHVAVPADSKGALGRLTAVKSSVSEAVYHGFDAKGRVTASAQITPAPGTDGVTAPRTYLMSYEYDLTGNLKSQTYPTGRKITNTYDEAGRIATVSGAKPGAAASTYVQSLTYSPSGKTESMKLGNGLWEHVKYNSRFQPTEIGLGAAADRSAALLKLEYQYGALVGGTLDPTKNSGNIQSQSITVAAQGSEPELRLKQEYEYDALNRLRSAQEGGGAVWRQTFDYDRFGNREVNAAGTTDSIELPRLNISGSNNRITAAGYFYDEAGNLTDEPGHTYKYDGEGKLSEHDGGPQAFPAGGGFGYDGEGRRITKKEGATLTLFVYNALGQLVAEYSHAVRAGGTNYLTQDHLGNTRVVTDGFARVVSRHDYLPFGEELHAHLVASGRERIASYNAGTVRQKYASKERDRETGLDFFGTRYYSSAQGRFTSPDSPFADQYPQNPQSWNLYAYARNNPVRVGDLNGEITPWDVLDVISLVISAYEFYQEPTLENAAWLAGDLVGAVLPIVPFGSIRRGIQGVELASDLLGAGSTVSHVVSKADDVGDAGRFMFKGSDDFVEQAFKDFPAPGQIDYGQLDELGRPTGVRAHITEDMLGTGTHAKSSIEPPGWSGDGKEFNEARGHLLGKQLGGSGDIKENLVTLQHTGANTPVMRDFENSVASAVRAGETVEYVSIPIYRGRRGPPQGVTLMARGSRGFRLNVTVLNPPGR